ncbi:MAG TPA: choice-of-anchor D domain-containing protein [Bryobacteraceae bacterium]|nr:choice-of-anchor D domain-containing protein [Bryobacteraceae bacterium]
MRIVSLFAAACAAAGVAFAGQANYQSSGGTVTLGSDFVVSASVVSSPPGTLSISCPVTPYAPGQYSQLWACAGGTLTLQSSDGSTSITTSSLTGTLTLTASGGGRGNPTKYYYSLAATFAGTMTVNGQSQAILGSTTQNLAPSTSKLGTGTIGSATTAVNSRYEPTYIADTYNNRIVRIDDILGSNWRTLGTAGAGVNQFSTPSAAALDPAGRIYVSDTGNCRIVRVDNITGKNWTSYGSCGAGMGQFSAPVGLAVDASGRIYVADSGNNRVVRLDDMTGSGWVALGSAGSGAGQFAGPQGVAADAAGRIYITDAGNARVVRVGDMTGANWTTLGTGGSGNLQFSNPAGIALDLSARIYVADAYNNRIVRMDDMTGANWTVLGGQLGSGAYQFINPYGVSVDSSGGIYVADTHSQRIVRTFDMTGLGWTSLGTGGVTGVGSFNTPYGVFAVLPPKPVPVVLLSATRLAFPDEVLGVPSPSQTVTLTNIGSAPLNFLNISVTGDFTQVSTCPASLAAGQSCTFTVTFQPSAPGLRKGALTLSLGGGATSAIGLSGIGTLVLVSPLSLNFGQVLAGDLGATLQLTVSNPSPAAAPLQSIAITVSAGGVFRQSNNCGNSVPAGASCTVTVRFVPQASNTYSGMLAITDGSGTVQKVSLTGVGVSN